MADDMTGVTIAAITGERVHTHVRVWCAMAGESIVKLTLSGNTATAEQTQG